MKNIVTIFKKEFLDLSRDKRTMRIMILMPLLLYPLIITLISKYTQSETTKALEQGIRIGIVENGNENTFIDFTKNDIPKLSKGTVPLMPVFHTIGNDTSQIKKLIDADSIDAAFWFSSSFDSSLAHRQPADYKMFYYSSNHEFKIDMLFGLNETFKNYIIDQRLKQLQIDNTILTPFPDNNQVDLASKQEQTGAIIGGILPYFFIIFCLLGCMYPGIDMAAGEKERGTLETLLVSSASRLEIFVGKFLVVASCGFISAIAAILGLTVAIKFNDSLPAEITDTILNILNPKSVAMIFSLLIPLNIFFASVILTLSIWAKSFKEAQSMVSPLMILAVVPSMLGMLPGIKHDMATAWIPILNVSLGVKAIISGTAETVPLIITYISLLLVASLGVYTSVRFFNNEKNILRG